MNKIEKRFKSFLASVCVFAFLCFGSTSVVALESSGSIKNIGWSISSDYCSRTKMEIGMQYSKATYVLLTG